MIRAILLFLLPLFAVAQDKNKPDIQYFMATRSLSTTMVEWVGAENDSRCYIIQKSRDSLNYLDMDTVCPFNTGQADYYFRTDTSSSEYYRLVHVDNNGRRTMYPAMAAVLKPAPDILVFERQEGVEIIIRSRDDMVITIKNSKMTRVYNVSGTPAIGHIGLANGTYDVTAVSNGFKSTRHITRK